MIFYIGFFIVVVGSSCFVALVFVVVGNFVGSSCFVALVFVVVGNFVGSSCFVALVLVLLEVCFYIGFFVVVVGSSCFVALVWILSLVVASTPIIDSSLIRFFGNINRGSGMSSKSPLK